MRIVSKLGAGGMASVYLGEDAEAKGALRALKLLSVAAPEPYKVRFEREARIGAGLDHPLLVRVHRHGVSGDFLYLVMDYVEGEDLASVLARAGALDWPLAAALGRDVAAALAALHERQVVHRDLKPQNVLLDARGAVRLADFGLSRWRRAPAAIPTEVSLTATGEAMGTPLYMAPEQFEDAKTVGPAADLYSLGVIVFEALAGRPPFSASTPLKLSILHREVAPPSLEAMAGSAPPELRRLVEALLAKDPTDRPTSAEEVAAAFAALAERGEAAPLPLETPCQRAPSLWDPRRAHPSEAETLPPPSAAPDPPSALRFAAGMAALFLFTLGSVLLAQQPRVRALLASPEEVARYEALRAALDRIADADQRAELQAAFAAYLRDFGEKGWLRDEVQRLRRRPRRVRANLYYVPLDDALMVYVPAGDYAIGDLAGKDDPRFSPPHRARLQGFLIDRTEVSNARYETFLARWRAAGAQHACGRTDLDHDPPAGDGLSPAPDGPRVGLSPWDALEYARFYGRRLPSEDEWEVAAAWDPQDARARLYPWGEREPSEDERFLANLRFAGFGEVDEGGVFRPLCAPSGTFELDRSGFGLLDVAGNAGEWCAGALPLPGKQPIRGGDLFTGDALAARLTHRREHDPQSPPPESVGFRTVLPFAGE